MNTVICQYKNISIITDNDFMDKKQVLKQIGKNIQKARLKKGLTQETFSELMGVSWSYVAKIETGILNLSIGKINEIADYLKIDINDILVIKNIAD